MKKFKLLAPVTIAGLLVLSSCKKDKTEPTPEPEPVTPAYTVPSTYEFGTNTNFTTSKQRVAMLKEMIDYIKTSHNATTNITIDAQKIEDMFANTANRFNDAGALGLNSSGISVKEKTNNTFNILSELGATFSEAATVSQSTVAGSDGQAGKVLGPAPTTTNGTQSAYLMNAKGVEYKEIVEKNTMGALMYAEATTLLKNIGNFDNTTAETGKGTAMEHAWDEAFGYFGVPVAFPTTTTGLLFWGNYCNAVNGAIGSNTIIMNAWLKGRAAISNKDYAARDAARDVIIGNWEKVCAARLITYLKQAKTNFANNGPRNHVLSESMGFIRSFRYNSSKTISDADIETLLGYIGDNLYKVNQSNIDAAINKVATVFSLDANKL